MDTRNPSSSCMQRSCKETMAGMVLRRSARLAAAAAAASSGCGTSLSVAHVKLLNEVGTKSSQKRDSMAFCGQHAIVTNCVKTTASFAKKAACGKKNKTLKGTDPVDEELSDESMPSETLIENLVSQRLSPSATLKSQKQTQAPAKLARSMRKMPSRDLEAELWEMGYEHIAGVDEAGRGPLAGPVVAAACIIPSSINIEGIDDSKRLSEERREALFCKLTSMPGISYAVHVIDAQTIDEVNILEATMQAMDACVEKLRLAANGIPGPDYILVDGNRLPVGLQDCNARSVVKGDALCQVIAAASILAKVTRDRLMIDYDKRWPVYGFKSHKGYGTVAHIAALLKHGPCDIHRRSFAPLKDQDIVSVTDL